MIFKTIKLLEWRVTGLEMELEVLRQDIDHMRMSNKPKAKKEKKAVEQKEKRGRGRPRKNK